LETLSRTNQTGDSIHAATDLKHYDAMDKIDENKELAIELMRQTLNSEVVDPFIKSMCTDIMISIKLTNAIYLTTYTEMLIDKSLSDLSKKSQPPQNMKEIILFTGYFGKIYKSSLYLLGATDYLSSIILMRSLFELLIGISTKVKGGMKERLDSIDFLSSEEKKILKKFWNNLCAWSHPYNKWLKKVCPIAYSADRFYQPHMFKQGLAHSDNLLDFMLTVIVEVLHLSSEEYKDCLAAHALPELSMFNKRIGNS